MGKTNLEKWGDLYCHKGFDGFLEECSKDGVHQIGDNVAPYHVLVNGFNRNPDFLMVAFTGAVIREKKLPPYFSYMEIARNLNLGLFSIADPSLLLSKDLGLAWYVGNKVNGNIAKILANLLDRLIEKTGRKLILCGGSGGGFAALNIQQLMVNFKDTDSVVFNPQTNVVNYNEWAVKRYFSSCFEELKNKDIESITDYFNKNKLSFIVSENSEIKRLILINGYDPNHVRKHVSRLIDFKNNTKTKVLFGDWGVGHVAPDRKFHLSVLRKIIEGEDSNKVGEGLEGRFKPALMFISHKKMLDEKIKIKIWETKVAGEIVYCVQCNIFDFFMGYSIKFAIYDNLRNKLIFDSDYVLGADMDGFILKAGVDFALRKKNFTLKVYVKDISDCLFVYDFGFFENLIGKKIKKIA